MIYWYFKNNKFQFTSNGQNINSSDDYTVIESKEDIDPTKTYELVDGKITITGDAIILTSEQLKEAQWPIVREKRDKLLQETDWTQLPDIPQETKNLWESYRQELRDITKQSDPHNIIWPTLPK
jgi:hypothetical protein